MLLESLPAILATMEKHVEELHRQWLAALEIEKRHTDRRHEVEDALQGAPSRRSSR